MKSRLAASFYLYFAGTRWRNTRSRMSSPVTFLDRRHGQISCSFQALRFENSNRAVHSSALEDDEFSELGPRISHCASKNIQFVAEIPDDFVDDDFSELGPRISESNAEKPDDLVDDNFSKLGPGISECFATQIKLVTEKPDDFVDDNFSELGPGISECFAEKMKLAADKHDDFVDDNFSELIPVISECFTKQIKLVTEKPDRFLQKTHNRKRGLRMQPLSSDNRSSVIQLVGITGKTSRTSGPKLGGYDHATSITDDTRKISDIERSPRSVSIKNVPFTVRLPEVVEAISVFGKVSGSSFVTASNRFKCCNIEFEDVESSRRAVLFGKVTVGSQVFPIDPHDAVDLVTVRIKNISATTSDYEIHYVCKSVGELVGLTRANKDCVDAFFNVRNHTIHLDIVKRLNNTTVDLNRWSAHVITSKSKLSNEEGRDKLGLQIFDGLSKLRRQLIMKRIWLEDLEYLNASIMHID